ncbi:hydrogen gas-evolving membrane-bound hydrogenase subunit E [Actinoplanes subglobosus]|uniref:Hydrogen gas-evolving membrane-bound hydrogenase subunit E n=1 Tax=Actinoplanes subglobosus TaxID=1547892 RepID=A0ABV8IXC7_9ACTN
MLILLAAHLVAAMLAPVLVRFLGPRAFYVLATAPLAVVGWAVTNREGAWIHQWVPDLGLSLAFRVDALSWLLVMLVGGVGALVLAYCARYFTPETPGLGRFAAVFVGFAGAMLGLVASDDLLLMYVFWELTTVFSYLLIGHTGTARPNRRAALQALIVTTTGGLAMLVGIVILGQHAGGYSWSQVAAAMPDGPLLVVAVVLILCGALSKSAIFPVSFWLPAAMAAPTPVSAYLHAAAMVKAGVFLIAGFAPMIVAAGGTAASVWQVLVVGLGLVTMLLGGWAALFQHDLKLLLAYGTVSQLGLLTAVLGFGTAGTALAGVAMLLAHALFKASLFLVVGVIDKTTGTRDLRRLQGLGRRAPMLAVVAVTAAASMAGLPPAIGFVGKEAVFAALLDAGTAGRLTLAGVVAGSILTVAYTKRFLWGAFATKDTHVTVEAAAATHGQTPSSEAANANPAAPCDGKPGTDTAGRAADADGNPGIDAPGRAADADGNPGIDAPGRAADADGNPGIDAARRAIDADGKPGIDAPGRALDGDGKPGTDTAGQAAGRAGQSGERAGVPATPTVPAPAGLLLFAPAVLAVAGVVAGCLADVVEGVLSPYHQGFEGAGDVAHLALWHGLGVPLLLSVLAVAGGLALFRLMPAGKAGPRPGGGVYERVMTGMDRIAVEVTGATQRGSLPFYLAVILIVLIATAGPAMVAGWPDQTSFRVWDTPLHLVPVAVSIAAAAFAVPARRRLTAVILVGVTGYANAGIFLLHGAPDLALTQFLVETVTLVMVVLVLRRLPSHFSQRPGSWRRRIRVGIGVAVGTVMAGVGYLAVSARQAVPVSEAYPEMVVPYGGGHNIVNVILVDIRAWDTMGEVAVLVAVATGVASLIFRRAQRLNRRGPVETPPEPPHDEPVWLMAGHTLEAGRRSTMLEVVTRLLFHIIVLLSVYLLFTGHDTPGGGFTGGLVAGLALIVRYLAGGRYELATAAPVDAGAVLGAGLLIAVGSGAAALVAGGEVLQSAVFDLHLPVFGDLHLVTSTVFDIGVYLIVVGLVLDVLRSLGAEVDRHALPEATEKETEHERRPQEELV